MERGEEGRSGSVKRKKRSSKLLEVRNCQRRRSKTADLSAGEEETYLSGTLRRGQQRVVRQVVECVQSFSQSIISE